MRQYILPIMFAFLGGTTCFAQSDPSSASRAVLFVVDKSGSMDGQKIIDAKTSAKAASREALRRGAKVGVLTFSGSCSGSDMLTLPFTNSQAEVDQFIDRVDTGGGTPLAPAIKEASRIFRNQGIDKDRAITVILADGNDDCGGVDGALAELKNHNFLNRHETVGLEVSAGSKAQQQLEQIANATGGTYQASANSAQLERVLVNAVSKSVLLDMVGRFKPTSVTGNGSSSAKTPNTAAAKLRAKANKKRSSGASTQKNNKTASDIRKKFQKDKAPLDAQAALNQENAPKTTSEKTPIKAAETPLSEPEGETDPLDKNPDSDDQPTPKSSENAEDIDDKNVKPELGNSPPALSANSTPNKESNLPPEGKPRRAGVAMCTANAQTPENNKTDTTYALVHTSTRTNLQDMHGRGLKKLVYDEVESGSYRIPSCSFSPSDGYEAGGNFVVLKSVMQNYAKEERVTYALGFGLNADAALAEGIAEMKRRNWSWIEDGHGYTVESTGEFD